MLRVELSNIKPGMRLAMRVEHPQLRGHVLLKAGYEIDPESTQRLHEFGIRYIWVRYPSLDFLAQFVSQEVLTSQHEVVNEICGAFEMAQRGATARLRFDHYVRSVGALVTKLIENPQAALFMGDIMHSDCNDLKRHSSAVTYLSLLMGMKLEGYIVRQRRHINPGQAKEVTNLGVGAMLHDIGVTELEEDVRQRFYTTGNDTDPAWREHPSLGYETVRGKIEPSAAIVVLNHHQRCDGSGYAGKDRPVLDGLRIHVFARIAAVADTFDQLCHPSQGPPKPAIWALSNLLRAESLPLYDHQALRALLAVAPPYPPGSMVRLSDNQWAVCVDHNVDAPCRPTVQIIPDPSTLSPDDIPTGPTIDLSELPADQLGIVEADGVDVRAWNFTVPEVIRAGLHQAILV